MDRRSSTSLQQQYAKIITAVSAYWIVSISLVFINKHLLSSSSLDAPVFVTWYQCFISVLLCYICSVAARKRPDLISFPEFYLDQKMSREVLPLSFIFVGMILFNNLCLQNVGVGFYYIGRSLTTVFNVICTYIILGDTTSCKAISCCLLIIFGFFAGVKQEDVLGSLSMLGVTYGVLASLCVALNAIYTKKTLPLVGDNIWRLTLYNNLNALFIFMPIMLVNGDLFALFSYQHLFDSQFWFAMTVSGVLGFAMGYVTGLQIQVTSALTHNISGTAKAAAQTVLGVIYYAEVKTAAWWMSNAIVLFGSAAYTYVKKQEMKKSFSNVISVKALNSDLAQSLLSNKASDLSDDDDFPTLNAVDKSRSSDMKIVMPSMSNV